MFSSLVLLAGPSDESGQKNKYEKRKLHASVHRLAEYCDMISHLFQCHRHDGGLRAERYISGLLCSAARKNMERIGEAIPKTNSQQLQQFLSSSPWKVGPVWNW